MRKRKLAKQIVSFSLAIAMAMGCLSNVPMTAMAQTASETIAADEVTSGTNATDVTFVFSANSTCVTCLSSKIALITSFADI